MLIALYLKILRLSINLMSFMNPVRALAALTDFLLLQTAVVRRVGIYSFDGFVSLGSSFDLTHYPHLWNDQAVVLGSYLENSMVL